jgi:hypothetical protein
MYTSNIQVVSVVSYAWCICGRCWLCCFSTHFAYKWIVIFFSLGPLRLGLHDTSLVVDIGTVLLNVNPAHFFGELTSPSPHTSPQRREFWFSIPACIPRPGEHFIFQPRTYSRNSYLFTYLPSYIYSRNQRLYTSTSPVARHDMKRSPRKRRFDTIGDDESRRECTSE